MSTWRAISTAPTDGTLVDLWFNGQRYADAYWGRPEHTCGEAGQYCDSCPTYDGWVDSTFMQYLNGEDGEWGDPPTHWMPIPVAPLGAKAGTADRQTEPREASPLAASESRS